MTAPPIIPSAPVPPPPPVITAPSPERTLRRLFLTLFLRGRTSRGLRRGGAPKSVGAKLGWTLLAYAIIGAFMAFQFGRMPIFTASFYLQSMTLVFLGMFVAASAGEILFNKDEAEILMHRPISPRTMLWAKIAVLVQVSLWLSAAFNLGGMVAGAMTANPGWLFPFIHAFSASCEALFCTGCIIMIYQLCLRWFGREKMEGLMTMTQVIVAVGAVMIGQVGPQLIGRYNLNLQAIDVWWIKLLPPAWFAGLDDAATGSHQASSWILGGIGLGATTLVLWLAFGKLAKDYETGLQALNESAAAPVAKAGRRRFIDRIVKIPPLSWWLRDPAARASFLLTTAYLVRDRDVKLRVYPGLAPMLVMPFIFLLQETNPAFRRPGQAAGFMSGFPIAFAGAYMGLIPYLGLSLIRYSQQWQASDIFRVVPLSGPSPLCHGARRAILLFLTVPLLIVFAVMAFFLGRNSAHLALFLPGLILLPVYSLIPCFGGKAIPLSLPTEESKSASRGLNMIVFMLIAVAVAFLSTFAFNGGYFVWLVAVELVVVVTLYFVLRAILAQTPWPRLES